MSDFCKQCSEELFGEDTGDMKDISTESDTKNNMFAVVLCESCGPIQVDHNGQCIGDCNKNHPLLYIE